MKIRPYLLISLILLLFMHSSLFAKKREFSIEELKTKYGTNKVFFNQIELSALIALSYFPELANTAIQFELKKMNTTMSARPAWTSIFSTKRKYVICLNSKSANTTGVDFEALPLEAKVGIVAHEFSHIAQYESLSKANLLWCGIAFKCIPNYHRKLERSTDKNVIEHGLGTSLLCFAEFVLTQSSTTEKYKNLKRNFYLSPAEIAGKL